MIRNLTVLPDPGDSDSDGNDNGWGSVGTDHD